MTEREDRKRIIEGLTQTLTAMRLWRLTGRGEAVSWS
jgi:hypothetical protein